MRAVLLSTILLVTIPAAMAFGVGLGYAAIIGIISLFGRKQRPRPHQTVKMPALAAAGD